MLRTEELERLLAACAGTSFEDRRDTAIIRLLASTGLRRGEDRAAHGGPAEVESPDLV